MKTKHFFPLFVLLALTACATPPTPEQQAKADRMAALSKEIDDNYVPVAYVAIACEDHTDTFITGYTIQDLVSTRKYGGGSCGGTNAAGYPLPKQWRPGMKVKVKWKLDGQPWRETTTNIMRYDSAEMLFIHIYNNDQVRVVSSKVYPGGPKHPIDGDSKIPPPEGQ
ncbi:DUF3304 domain-containing protein [Collimonas pratensis]|uniref:DUF3304 domain-containing protein n=1 Tax=Collimonas pratensis TaxID=279113 RepID=UPI00143CE5E2|nr:DUF3304 domain-containing protein [Collimonas pratensis]NKI68180.1 DUF3304 domain-containing protein [Collimonas pratensis]